LTACDKAKEKRYADQCSDQSFADWTRAQQIAHGLEVKRLHHRLDEFARRFCPIHRSFGVAYHWSVDQCEYATDIVFKRQASETLSTAAEN
jgi:hypothetical protein